MSYVIITYPPRKTQEERRLTHKATYGPGAPLPARGYRFRPTVRRAGLSPNTSLLLILLGAGALIWLMGRK